MKVQLIAYEIDTHDTAKLNSILKNKGIEYDEVSEENYFVLQANLLRDQICNNIIQSGQLDSNTLTIFMAPEFYFKYKNGNPYSRTTLFNQLEYLRLISEAYPEVLFVAGSIWWSEPTKPVSNNQVIVHNTVPIFFGGKIIHTWQKTRLSQIDGLNQGTEQWDRWEAENQRILEATQTPFFQINFKGDESQPIKFGIEVCLDHLTLQPNPPTRSQTDYGVLRTSYLTKNPNTNTGSGVDVHLLVAAGMPLQSENIVARDGGVIFRCDGGLGAIRSNSVKITRQGISRTEALRKWNPKQRIMTPDYLGDDTDNRLAIYDSVSILP
jgi:hypothetical protein